MEVKPLADRLRPQNLETFAGQTHLIHLLSVDPLPSLIFWGPPGCGKTTLALLIAKQTKAEFHHLSAVLAGIQELRNLTAAIEKESTTLFRRRHILFIDEIHRWNKAQQDALLPFVEQGTITLIGATTENPSFEVIGPLLSRCKVVVLNSLNEEELKKIVQRGMQELKTAMTDEAMAFVIQTSDGDARRALNTLEIASALRPRNDKAIGLKTVEQAVQKKSLLYDKKGEEHYNVISAFIKSMRGSDPNAAVYYLARMYEAGEDPRFIARRMVIFASEDIGNADPEAIRVAVSAFQAYEIVGQAEGWIPLAHAATYLAKAPKSKASYQAYKLAKADVEAHGALPTPLHLRNAPTELMKDLGYGKGPAGENLPEKLKGKIYYKP